MNDYFDDPFQVEPTYNLVIRNWELVDVLLTDSDTLRAQGERYLYKGNSEKDPAYVGVYEDRLKHCFLPPGYKEELQRAVGIIADSEKPINIGFPEKDQDIGLMMEDIDLMGNSVGIVGIQMLHDVIHYGCCVAVIEHQDTSKLDTITHETERMLGARPYLVRINPKNVLGFAFSDSNGLKELSQVRILEERQERVDGFLYQNVRYVRVYELINSKLQVTLYKKCIDGTTLVVEDYPKVLLDTQRKPHTKIPIIVGYAAEEFRVNFARARPVMLDLAENIIKAYNVESNLESLIRFVLRVYPINYIKTEDPVKRADELNRRIGGRQILAIGIDEDFSSLQYDSKSIEAGEHELERIKEDRRYMGFNAMLSQRPGNIAATTKALERVSYNNLLQAIIIGQVDFWENIIDWFYRWVGRSSEDYTVTINNDFSKLESWSDNPQNVQNVINLYTAGLITLSEAREVLKSTRALGSYSENLNVELLSDSSQIT